MCGKNHQKSAPCKEQCLREASVLQYADLVVVGVENETEQVSVVLRRILEDGQNVPMKLDNITLPSWFDIDKFKRGQRYFYNNYYAMFVSKLCGLLLVLAVPSILKVLILTGKSSTPAKAFRRYMDTISNMLDWYNGDLNKKDSKIYKVLISVRGKHCAAAKKAVTNGASFISQKDLALTQFGFMGLAVLRRKFLGIVGSTKDLEGFIHFWKTIGYFMGIEDRFNICYGSVDQVTEICEKLADDTFRLLLLQPSDEFIQMADALLVGLKPMVPLQDKDAFMEFTRRILNLPAEKLKSTYARMILSLTMYIHTTVLAIWWVALIMRPVLNVLLRFSVYGNINLPIMAMMTMGKEVLGDQPVSVVESSHQQVGMAVAH